MQIKRLSRVGGVGILACFLAAACQSREVPVSSATEVSPALAGKSLRELTELFNRKARRDKLNLSVTLWDRAFVEAFLERRAEARSWNEEKTRKAVKEWTRRFLENQTTFRVRLEALARPLTVKGKDAVVALDEWRWELWDSNGRKVEAHEVKVETKKVFAGKKGQYDFRVDGNVHFNYEIAPGKVDWIEIVATPPGDARPLRLPKWKLAR